MLKSSGMEIAPL